MQAQQALIREARASDAEAITRVHIESSHDAYAPLAREWPAPDLPAVFVAILFGLMHLPGWIALNGVSMDLVSSTLMIVVPGAVLGGVARASNSILPAIALHCSNNVLGEWLGGR